ncbi:SDR family oxidoreductase [bacterium]|nr:SDR family oxidoreductase [bacterium]
MTGRLQGRVAVVTGASSGLGRRFASLLAREGACVAAFARREDRLADLVSEITGAGGRALAVRCDVTDEAQVVAGFDRCEAEFGPADTLINNAGIGTSGPATELSVADFDSVMATNVRSVFLASREAARRMLKSPERAARGRIVNIASLAASEALAGGSAYCASKSGVVMLTRVLAREWARAGVNVNAISPGFIETDLNTEWLHSPGGQKMIERMPRRRTMDADSLDEALVFLASDASRFVTGSELIIDDGQGL